jgi:hypothetical protein
LAVGWLHAKLSDCYSNREVKILQLYRHTGLRGLSIVIPFFISLACSLPSQFQAQEESNSRPTRTPLPTFTPTVPMQISILPTPSNTPIPPPTEPPPPPEPPTETPIPAEPATDTPEPPPTEPPPPPPTEPPPPPPPTEPPPPPEPVAGAHGVIGKITFRDGKNTYAVGEKVFVKIEATNTGAGLLPFGILGLNTSTGAFQTSWSNGTIASGDTFRHEDGLPFPTPGTHKLWLSICFSSLQECQGPDGDWERFEPGLDVIVQ